MIYKREVLGKSVGEGGRRWRGRDATTLPPTPTPEHTWKILKLNLKHNRWKGRDATTLPPTPDQAWKILKLVTFGFLLFNIFDGTFLPPICIPEKSLNSDFMGEKPPALLF